MTPWVELLWCGLFLLLSTPPRFLGIRGAVIAAMLIGIPARLYTVAYTAPTLWMLSGIPWLVVIAFYVMTVLWVIYLIRLWRKQPVRMFAAVMARGALIESAAQLNAAAGFVIALVMGDVPRLWFAPVAGLVFSVAQMVYFFRMSKGDA